MSGGKLHYAKVNTSEVDTVMQKYFSVPHPLARFPSSPLVMHISRSSTYFFFLAPLICHMLPTGPFYDAFLYLLHPALSSTPLGVAYGFDVGL